MNVEIHKANHHDVHVILQFCMSIILNKVVILKKGGGSSRCGAVVNETDTTGPAISLKN